MTEGSEASLPAAEALPGESPPEQAQQAAAGQPEVAPSSLAVWAFVLALLGLVPLLPVIGSVLGFVLGRVAIRQADSRRVRGGRGLAIAAVTISVVTLAIIALAVAAYALAVAYLDI